jgi:type VI secretion system protein ImpH
VAASERHIPNDLIEDLSEHAVEYGFFHALRLMRQVFPGDPAVGTATRPSQESFRLNQSVTLNFAPSSVEKVVLEKREETDDLLQLWTYVFGLTGPNGPLPTAITEYILDRRRQFHDQTLESFFNVFHHRMLSFFFRAWVLNAPAANLEDGEEARFFRHLRSLIGIGMESMRNRDHVEDYAKVHASGWLSSSTPSQEGLESILAAYFEMPVRVAPYQGQWLMLPAEAQCRLGASEETGLLGLNTIVGSAIWECQIRFRIIFGPLTFDDYTRLLPGGNAFNRLRDWVRLYAGLAFEWEVQLVLKREEVCSIQLGGGALLGWTTWLVTGQVESDRGDLVLEGDFTLH